MIYISFAECENNYKSQHDTAYNLLTSLLSALVSNDLEILKEPCGRPYVNQENVDVSISHSHNLVAVGVTTNVPADFDCCIEFPIEADRIGIDIELIDRNTCLESKNKLAKRFLSKEATSIEDFFSLWTENEAKGKISGEGVLQSKNVNCDVLSFTVILEERSQEYCFSFAYTPKGGI